MTTLREVHLYPTDEEDLAASNKRSRPVSRLVSIASLRSDTTLKERTRRRVKELAGDGVTCAQVIPSRELVVAVPSVMADGLETLADDFGISVSTLLREVILSRYWNLHRTVYKIHQAGLQERAINAARCALAGRAHKGIAAFEMEQLDRESMSDLGADDMAQFVARALDQGGARKACDFLGSVVERLP